MGLKLTSHHLRLDYSYRTIRFHIIQSWQYKNEASCSAFGTLRYTTIDSRFTRLYSVIAFRRMRSLSLEALGSPAAETDIKAESSHLPVTSVGLIRRFHSQSRPRLTSPSPSDKTIERLAQYHTSIFQESPTENSNTRSFRRRTPSTTTQTNDNKAYMSSYSVKSPSFTDGLVKENRSLHQRIAALQRTESDLLNENQELAGRLSSAQRRYNSRRQQWAEELMNRENTLNARIRDLEARLAQKEEALSRKDFNRIHEGPLNEADIVIWLTTKTTAWLNWVDDFTHQNPNRVRSGLHPMQLRELCEGVKHFVRLNNKGELPEELLNPPHSDRSWPSRILLHGMLANFIIFETLKSPFWVFDAISANANELESPSTPRLNSISPVGFRMDLVPWSSSIVPPRNLKPPQPLFAAQDRLSGSRNVRELPRLTTSTRPPDSSKDPLASLFDQDLPSRKAMESFYHSLLNGMTY